jgi:hypothetical protein
MKRTLSYALLLSAFVPAMFTSCQKKDGGSTDTSKQELTIDEARSYQQRLETKYGNYDLLTTSSGKTIKNYKQVDFSKAYVGENETSFYVEAPISYTTREVVFSTGSGVPSATLKKMTANSFDRFVVYKDKMSGMISEKIVTVIPSADYISKGNKDLYNNHYQSIIKDFSGYVSYRNWKGKFLSSHSYNLANSAPAPTKAARVNDIICNYEIVVRTWVVCEDFDEYGNGVNCADVSIETGMTVCEFTTPDFVNHSAPLPDKDAEYWDGWPEPHTIPAGTSCPQGTRPQESPIMFAAISADGTTFSQTLYSGCFCYGYSFLILEDVTTGVEYSFPIENQNFVLPDCTSLWETNVQIPASVPNGQYFAKIWQDGDLFYHQFELSDGTVVRRFKHTLSR